MRRSEPCNSQTEPDRHRRTPPASSVGASCWACTATAGKRPQRWSFASQQWLHQVRQPADHARSPPDDCGARRRIKWRCRQRSYERRAMSCISIAIEAPAAGHPQCRCEAGVGASQAATVVCFSRTTQVMHACGRGPLADTPRVLLLHDFPSGMTVRSHQHAWPYSCICIVCH